MIDFSITDNLTGKLKAYSLPTSWADVSWKQYQDYTALNEVGFDSLYDKSLYQLSALTGLDLDTLYETGWQVVVELFKHLDFLQEAPTSKPIAHVTINNKLYYPQKLKAFGELIAYDKVMNAEGMSYEQKIPYILAICLRQKHTMTVEKPVAKGWKKLLKLKETVVEETKEVEPLLNDSEWIEERAKLFAHSLNVAQVQALAAFFLSNADALQHASRTFSKLHPKILRRAQSLERICHAITAGNWQSGIFARLLLKSINCYFYLLTKYFNVSNTNAL